MPVNTRACRRRPIMKMRSRLARTPQCSPARLDFASLIPIKKWSRPGCDQDQQLAVLIITCRYKSRPQAAPTKTWERLPAAIAVDARGIATMGSWHMQHPVRPPAAITAPRLSCGDQTAAFGHPNFVNVSSRQSWRLAQQEAKPDRKGSGFL